MIKICVFSGFLGSGKTTLIKKLLEEAFTGEKIVLIENEFGEIGIDSGFLAEAGVHINEMNSGCICCSLVGDFAVALQKVISEFAPDRILIEPSGVGKLSDVVKAVHGADTQGAVLGGLTTVVDAKKCKMHMKNFGEFFNDQVENAQCIVLSHTQFLSDDKVSECVELLRQHNSTAVIVTTPWDKLSGAQILDAIERTSTLEIELKTLEEQHVHEHHHHEDCCHHDHEHHHHEDCCHHEHEHHHHDDCCHHEHEHHHHEDCCHHEHEHHHHEDCCHHEHEHHHHEDCCHHEHEHHHHEDCCHHEHEHHHEDCCHHEHGHHHHHADEVFVSYGAETIRKFNAESLKAALDGFSDVKKYGNVLRAKGIVESDDGRWIHFDYIPGESDIRFGAAGVIGRLCVIGSELHKDAISETLNVNFN